jgi:hypothetical protein
MKTDESLETILAQHLDLCEATYELLLAENRYLKQTGQPPDSEFLNQKQGLLLRFEVAHRAIAQADRAQARQLRGSIEKAQQVVLKTLLLDRENEQLLLKCALTPKTKITPPPASSTQVQKTYKQAAGKNRRRKTGTSRGHRH